MIEIKIQYDIATYSY